MDSEKIIIKSSKSSLFVRITLLFLILVSLIIPIISTIIIFVVFGEFHFGNIFSFLIFWGIGFYLTRIFLWNTFGSEILTLKHDKIKYVADYKFFKDSNMEIELDTISISYIESIDSKTKYRQLILSTPTNSIQTVLKMTITEYEKIEKLITTRYNYLS